MLLVGVDTGGTFTDFVVYSKSGIRVHKELSTPTSPETAIMKGLSALDLDLQTLLIIHGTTVATNAVLERKLAKTVYVTNRGFRDLLTIGRQARAELYNLTPAICVPPVSQEYCIEVGGRINSDGVLIEEITQDDILEVEKRIKHTDPEAVAVNLLFSFLNPNVEQSFAKQIGGGCFVTCSSEILPDYREYERGIATWLNASIGPKLKEYLGNLASLLKESSLAVMQSNGMTCSPEYAGDHAVNLLLSGPAGGLIGASYVAEKAGHKRIMTFDMGGTSTDVALIDGEICLTTEGHVGGYPVAVPMVEMHTIGAGGGSMARVDLGGLLQVGPDSAGANPGPACYGRGGKRVTVTDANLVVGRLPCETHFSGGMELDLDKATVAMKDLAKQLRLSEIQTAQGVLDIVNNLMVQALKEISVERGIDPSGFTLVPFGGSGGLHCCSLAEALSVTTILIPQGAGVLSALGMIVAKPGRKFSSAVRKKSEECNDEMLRVMFTNLLNKARAELISEGHDNKDIKENLSADLCYLGQVSFLNLPFSSLEDICDRFPKAHKRRYGHVLDKAIEIVSVRISVTVERPRPHLAAAFSAGGVKDVLRSKYPVFFRQNINRPIHGPAIVVDSTATIFIDSEWIGVLDVAGNLILEYD